MPPITRREQLELDELLGDIYKGIETLPDKSQGGGVASSTYDIVRQGSRASNNNNRSIPQQVIGRAHVREYELPESSPLVQRHKQELRSKNAWAANSPQDAHDASGQQQRRSNIKYGTTTTGASGGRLTGGPGAGGSDSGYHQRNETPQQHAKSQSLASFLNANPVGSATPESKRRVRIVDPAAQKDSSGYVDDYDYDDYASNDYQNDSALLNYNDQNSESQFGSPSGSKKHRATPTNSAGNNKKKEKVKYVNTNKFIYHQERNPDDEPLENFANEVDDENIIPYGNSAHNNQAEGEYDDDDIDGVTRVEYYHTSWLDRQLGRASKRRSSKELNERQVKEKAMIEELKRSLKNGAITLRQSFKGKKNRSPKSEDIFDEQQYSPRDYDVDDDRNKSQNQRIKDSPSKVITSGLATIPKNHHHKSQKYSNKNSNSSPWSRSQQVSNEQNQYKQSSRGLKPLSNSNKSNTLSYSSTQAHSEQPYSEFDSVYRSSTHESYNTNIPVYKNSDQVTTSGSYTRPAPESPMQNQYRESTSINNQKPVVSNQQQYSSRTLPHKRAEQHQLLQSHYKGTLRDKSSTLLHPSASARPSPLPNSLATTNTLATKVTPTQIVSPPISAANQNQLIDNKMRNTTYNNNTNNNCSPNPHGGAKSPVQQQLQAASTISGMPSATEVVRTALSRSGSQVSLNQLNKTINLLPNSPPATSPMSPTQQLKPATPSLSPSPTSGFRSPSQQQYSSKTLGHQHSAPEHQYLPGQVVLHGTRTVGRPPQGPSPVPQQQSHQQQQQQPVYANPHTAFMQHRMEQQMKQPNRNVASIREFNELDSLLRSLSPGTPGRSSVQTQITPGYSSKPSQPTFGGYMPANQQQQAPKSNTPGDIYARVQRPQQQAQPQQQQQRPAGAGFAPAAPIAQPGFTVDVTNKKFDENCRRGEELSEFETPIELVPSMEDYQNIAKLNPVKNHYWYKPNMSRDMAISLLKDKPQGTFIVRDSTSFMGAYGLAVKVAKLPKNVLASLRNNNDPSAEFIRHFLIEPTGSGVRLKGYANEPVFDSLADLIYQHSLTELALPCKLIIPRADIEDPRFNQKQKQFFDEFIASKEQAKHQPYERTSPDGGYRRYPGDVYVHNEHRIIFE